MSTADATKISNDVRSQLPGTGKEVQKDAEVAGQQVSSKVNNLTRDAKIEASKVDAKLDQYRKEAGQQLDSTAKDVRKNTNAAIDSFDKNVTEVSERLFCRPGREGHRWAGGDDGDG